MLSKTFHSPGRHCGKPQNTKEGAMLSSISTSEEIDLYLPARCAPCMGGRGGKVEAGHIQPYRPHFKALRSDQKLVPFQYPFQKTWLLKGR